MDIKLLAPSFLGIYNLSTSELGCNAPYLVNNFLVFLSIACSSIFLQLTNAAEYRNRDTAQVLTPRTKFPLFSFDFKTFLNFLIYPLPINPQNYLEFCYFQGCFSNALNFLKTSLITNDFP